MLESKLFQALETWYQHLLRKDGLQPYEVALFIIVTEWKAQLPTRSVLPPPTTTNLKKPYEAGPTSPAPPFEQRLWINQTKK